jgi:hypothetical protein
LSDEYGIIEADIAILFEKLILWYNII